MNREVDKIQENNKGNGFNIESDEKSVNAGLKPSNSPADLSVKTKIPIKCLDPWRHIYSVTSKEGGNFGIMTKDEISIFNIHSTRIVKNTPPLVSQISDANHFSPICWEGYSVGEQVTCGALKMHPPGHVSNYLPKAQMDQKRVKKAEVTCCNLFCSLKEEGTLMLWD